MTTARSYCSGYGGLEMSVRAAFGDFEVLSHSDIKPAAVALLGHRYPDVPNLGDMREIDYTALEPADLMIGSWPCQPHSAAGKRLGEADPRDLWPEYERAIDAHRPAIFFGENVNRITGNGELRRVATSLARRGYVGAWIVRSASDVGACHLRKRCFVVAADTGGLELWNEPGRGSWAHGKGPGVAGHDGSAGSLRLMPTPKATDGTKGGPGMRGSSGDLMLPSAVQPANFGEYAEAIAHHARAFGQPAPAPTQPTRDGTPQLRAEFVEWMMMVPEGHVTGAPGLVDSPRKSERNAMLSLLGDGVVPAQGAAAFRFLLAHLAQRLAAGVAA